MLIHPLRLRPLAFTPPTPPPRFYPSDSAPSASPPRPSLIFPSDSAPFPSDSAP